MIWYGAHEQYTTSRELGRGGEGIVYELHSHSNLVLKKYSEPLTSEKVAKLRAMIAMRSPGIEAYAAWPVDLVHDSSGIPSGFVMKKLTGFVPMHMLFSPMDRKKLFPDKGYNFLTHVSRNLATAFHQLHEAGLVVGDVNEGNILISANGMVAFIDCDSFQVKGGDNYYYCEVGVPRYTPPELLQQGTFEQVVRTANTDAFSMAVLIFQLLFLGRHPFAGRNTTATDIDEETAIRQRLFAYSLRTKRRKLSPPRDSLDIHILPQAVTDLFHRAFEEDTRPSDAEWVAALDDMLKHMVTCTVTQLHTYPAGAAECPWCHFRQARGILYFLDDSYIRASHQLADIEQFVNGFDLSQLEIVQWKRPSLSGKAQPVPAQFYGYKNKANAFYAVASMLLLMLGAIVAGAAGTMVGTICAFLLLITYKHNWWIKKIKAELDKRKTAYLHMRQNVERMIAEHNTPPDLNTYNVAIKKVAQLVQQFRELPQELDRRRKTAEETLYNEQLDYYLRLFSIGDADIPSFGPAKKQALSDYGIFTAADISRMAIMKIPGIGPKNQQILRSWQRQMSAGFVYIPDTRRIAAEMDIITNDMARHRQQLENTLRAEYHSLNLLRQNIHNRSAILGRHLDDLNQKTYQAELDLDAFRRFAS